MNIPNEHIIPWDLIVPAMEIKNSPEEQEQLEIWLSADEENRRFFNHLKDNWEEGLADYNIYINADESIAWQQLQFQITNANGATVVDGKFNVKRSFYLRWVAAAIVVVLAGTYLWFTSKRDNIIYETAVNEQKQVTLPDGSTIQLSADTRIEVGKDYNQHDRKLLFKKGKAFFEVAHIKELPFIVDMGTSNIRDIGTSFTVQSTNDSISVSVKSGAVEFISKINKERKELIAGMSLKFRPSTAVLMIDSTNVIKKDQLHFENTSLSDVVARLQEVYGNKIILTDSSLMNKKFTAVLDGQSIEEVLYILTKSLNIRYNNKGGVYYLLRPE